VAECWLDRSKPSSRPAPCSVTPGPMLPAAAGSIFDAKGNRAKVGLIFARRKK
jgi:hypothetical protein